MGSNAQDIDTVRIPSIIDKTLYGDPTYLYFLVFIKKNIIRKQGLTRLALQLPGKIDYVL